jgi:hypothetical protein
MWRKSFLRECLCAWFRRWIWIFCWKGTRVSQRGGDLSESSRTRDMLPMS